MAPKPTFNKTKAPEHRTIMSIHKPINRSPVNMDSIEGMTPATDKMVEGQFINVEAPGQPAKICGKYYKGMQYFQKVFEDNEDCVIPLSVARFINERCYHDKHGYLLDERGQPMKSVKPQYRYKFVIRSYDASKEVA